MSDERYGKLVVRIRNIAETITAREADAILAEVFRTLETVTPQMRAAFNGLSGARPDLDEDGLINLAFTTMLRASPLAHDGGKGTGE